MVQIKRISHTKQIKRNFPNCIEMKYNLDVIKCYVMLCYVMLCYVMLCYVMLCYVMLEHQAWQIFRLLICFNTLTEC